MSFDTLGDLNWLAVIVATIAYFALGAIWYAPPVLGKPWMKAGCMEMPEGGSVRARRSTRCRWSPA